MTEYRASRDVATVRLLVERLRAIRPPRWWQEIGFIGLVYFLYSRIRNAVPRHEVGALQRSHRIVAIERWLHIDAEKAVNGFVFHHHWLAYGCDYYYSTLHFIVTIGVLVWLYFRHPLRYRAIRSVLLVTNLVALIGFSFISVAPPRMLPGFHDTVVDFHTWGSIASPGLAKASNQFAAMPSLHVGWALWCGIAIVTLARRRWVRVLGALYPLATLFVVVGTANHFFLDAVGGALTLLLAFGVEWAWAGHNPYRIEPIVVAEVITERELAVA